MYYTYKIIIKNIIILEKVEKKKLLKNIVYIIVLAEVA